MGRLGAVIAVLVAFASAPAVRPGLVAQSNPLASLAGTWVGSTTDSSGAVLEGSEGSDTLTFNPDSSFVWKRTINGQTQSIMVNPQRPDDHKWKRLTSTNISWFGGAGYDYKLEGDKLSLMSVESDPNGGGKYYLVLGRLGGPAPPPVRLSLHPPARPFVQLPASSGPLANLVGMWVGGPTDSSGLPLIGMMASDTLILNADSSFAWTRNASGDVRTIMVNYAHPGYYKWSRLTATNIKFLQWDFDYKLEGSKLSLVSVLPDRQWGGKVYLAFTRAELSAVRSDSLANPVAAGAAAPASPFEQAFEQTLELLKTKQFDSVEKAYATLQKDFEAGKVDEYEAREAYLVFNQREDKYRDEFDGWIKAYPKSASAYLARGIYFRKLGEFRRGTKYAEKTPRENLEYYRQMYELAKRDLETSLRLNPKSYLAVWQLLVVDGGRKYLDLGNRLLPSNLAVRAQYLMYLTPRWGGSYERMDEFLAESRSQGVSQDRLDLLTALKYNDEGAVAEEAGNFDQARLAYRKALRLSLSGGTKLGPMFRTQYLQYSRKICQEPEFRAEPYCQ